MREQAWRDLARLIDTEGGIYYYQKPDATITKIAIGNTNLQLLELTLKPLPILFNSIQIKQPNLTQTIKHNKTCYNLMCTRQDLQLPLLQAIQPHLFDSDKQERCRQAIAHINNKINQLTQQEKQEISNKLRNHGWLETELQQYTPNLPQPTAVDRQTTYDAYANYYKQRGLTSENIEKLLPRGNQK